MNLALRLLNARAHDRSHIATKHWSGAGYPSKRYSSHESISARERKADLWHGKLAVLAVDLLAAR